MIVMIQFSSSSSMNMKTFIHLCVRVYRSDRRDALTIKPCE